MRMINDQKCNWHKLLRVCIGRRRIKSTRIKSNRYAYIFHIISYDYCTCVIRILRSYFFSFTHD